MKKFFHRLGLLLLFSGTANKVKKNETPRCKQTGYRKATAQGNKIAASSGELTPERLDRKKKCEMSI